MALKRKSPKQKPVQVAFTRFMLIVGFFAIWIGAISVRLVHLQINQHEWLRARALNQRRDELRVKMLRGSIFDRSGRVLAVSVKANSLMADPSEIEDVQATGQAVAKALGVKASDLIDNINEAKKNGRRFVWLARRLDKEKVDQINEQLYDASLKKYDAPRFAGLHWREEQKRTYPQGTLAAHVIGFSNSDDVGQSGIEQSQERILRGEVEMKWRDRDRLGRVYDEEVSESQPPKDLVLTISQTIQYKVEQALERGVMSAKAKSGSAIAMDPKTGEILALASYPTFNPNNFNTASMQAIANIPVQTQFTPGSVFKIVTYGAALEQRLIAPGNEIDCSPSEIRIGNHLFRDAHKIGVVSYSDALAHSSNYAAIKTGMRLGDQAFYYYARKFGFGSATGIELPAEAHGGIRSPKTWAGDSLASMSIGYEVSVTAMQTIAAFATIANNGMRPSPHIIKGIRQRDESILPIASKPAQRIISEDTAHELRQMLQRVVSNGTGSRASLNGYTSAGKTGTAWKYDASLKLINREKVVSSFIGYAPADNPAVVIAVIIDEPQVMPRDGGYVAAPVFREIAQQVLPELEVLPDASLLRESDPLVELQELESSPITVVQRLTAKRVSTPTSKETEENIASVEGDVSKDVKNSSEKKRKEKESPDKGKQLATGAERKSKTGAVVKSERAIESEAKKSIAKKGSKTKLET